MATKPTKRPAPTPRRPEKKWGPFHGGVGVAVWLNEVETDDGKRYFRSITIAPRRYLDEKSGKWEDASSFRVTDLPSLILALQAAQDFVHNTPLPGLPATGEGEVPADSGPPDESEIPL
jgi:hypothetical protein